MHTSFELGTHLVINWLDSISTYTEIHLTFFEFFSSQPSLPVLYTLSSQATHEAVHLLCRMLVFDPVSSVCFLFVFLMN